MSAQVSSACMFFPIRYVRKLLHGLPNVAVKKEDTQVLHAPGVKVHHTQLCDGFTNVSEKSNPSAKANNHFGSDTS